MARDGRGGMGIGDRLVLLAAWVATCGFVYLLGFYVGKGTQERRLGLEERIVRLPVTSQPPPEGQRPKSENEFVFYDKLMGERGRESAKPAAPVPAAPAVAKVTAPPTPAADAAPRTAPAARPAPVVAVATPKPPPPAAAPSAAAAAPKPQLPPPTVAARPAVQTPAPPAPLGAPGWTVLANPTRSREEADGLMRQLRGRGYEATLVRVLRDGDTWYRVQVGRFSSSEQATEVMHRLREHEGVVHAFVASE